MEYVEEPRYFTVDRDFREFDRMWEELAKDPLNIGLAVPAEAYNEECNEAWQYMGTVLQQGGRWVHQFRHRCHPITQQRELRNIEAL